MSSMDQIPVEVLFIIYRYMTLVAQYRLTRCAKWYRASVHAFNGGRRVRSGLRHHGRYLLVWQLGSGDELDGRCELYRGVSPSWRMTAQVIFQYGILRSIHDYSIWERLNSVWTFDQRGWLTDVVVGLVGSRSSYVEIHGLVRNEFTVDTVTIVYDNHGQKHIYRDVPPGRYLTSEVSRCVHRHNIISAATLSLFEFHPVVVKAPEHVFYPYQLHLKYNH